MQGADTRLQFIVVSKQVSNARHVKSNMLKGKPNTLEQRIPIRITALLQVREMFPNSFCARSQLKFDSAEGTAVG